MDPRDCDRFTERIPTVIEKLQELKDQLFALHQDAQLVVTCDEADPQQTRSLKTYFGVLDLPSKAF